MAEILVRNLDERLVEKLKKHAALRGRSLQTEVKMILEQAAESPREDVKTARRLIGRIRDRFEDRDFPDSVKLIREDRDR